MKFLMIIASLVFVSTTAHARKVCGVEVGNTPITLASQKCNSMTEQQFIAITKSPGHSHKKCTIDGKSIIVGIAPLFFAIYDFTTPSTYKVCQGQKIPISFDDDQYQNFNSSNIEI